MKERSMKSKQVLLGGLAAAITLALSSCGDGNSSADTSGDAAETTASEGTTTYPLDVCVISGEKLGSMGEPHVITYKGTEMRFCCDSCVPEFNKDPEKYVAMIKAGKSGSVDHSGHNH